MGDAERRMTLFRLLEWAGHRATVVDTPRGMLEMLETEPFDLVLLDASPALDGYDVLRHIRMDPKLYGLPVLMVASQGGAGDVAWIDTGADGILAEPFVPGVVQAQVDASIARKRLPGREVQDRAKTGES